MARAHGDAEVEHLKNQGATAVTMGENEIARGMIGLSRREGTPAAAS